MMPKGPPAISQGPEGPVEQWLLPKHSFNSSGVYENLLNIAILAITKPKMTGGTLEVHSNKNLTFWHLTFDIWLLIFDILHPKMDQWTNGPVVQRTYWPIDQWTDGPMDQWTIGSMDKKLLRLYEIKNKLEHWNIWTLDHWNIGTLEHLTFNQHQFASCDINCIDTV